MKVYESVNIEHHKISQSAMKTPVDTFSYYTVFSLHKKKKEFILYKRNDFFTLAYVDGKPSYIRDQALFCERPSSFYVN